MHTNGYGISQNGCWSQPLVVGLLSIRGKHEEDKLACALNINGVNDSVTMA